MYKKLLILLLVLTVFPFAAFSQANPDKSPLRVIEVTGSAETLITPNEFTFKITLLERFEKKEKITIEMQEKALKDGLAKIGVDPQKELTIFDLTSVFVSRKKLKDTLGSKDYRLKLNDIEKIGRLQDLADDLNISRLDLIDSTHSELTRLRRETKMEAVKAAKMKADYMLGAIGEKTGKAAFIQEIADRNSDSLGDPFPRPRVRANYQSNSTNDRSAEPDDALSFTKIKLRYEVLARFEIQ